VLVTVNVTAEAWTTTDRNRTKRESKRGNISPPYRLFLMCKTVK
jgi:hypothetical protein